jgi:co-chaperonin GroES (HSP10)
MGLNALRADELSNQMAAHFSDPANEGKLFIPSAAMNGIARDSNVGFQYGSIEEAFPVVDPGEAPVGNMVLMQIRTPKSKTNGGIILSTDARQTEIDNTQVAKVIAIGPLAFHNRSTGEPWPEGAWAKVGDFVRVPKYQGDRFIKFYTRPDFEIDPRTGERRATEVRDEVIFAHMKDLAIISLINDPLTVRAYL